MLEVLKKRIEEYNFVKRACVIKILFILIIDFFKKKY